MTSTTTHTDHHWDGPALAAAVRGGDRSFLYAQYEYISDSPDWSREQGTQTRRWRKVPAWAATHIRIRAFYVFSGEPLEPLESRLRSMPGCVQTERVTGHAELRRQVVALFEKR